MYCKGLESVKLVKEFDIKATISEAREILIKTQTYVDKPKLRPWKEIIKEVDLLTKVITS